MSNQKVQVEITGSNAGLITALQGAGKATENMAHQMESAVGGIAATMERFMAPMAAFLGVLGGGAIFKEAVTETAQFGDEVAKSEQKIGIGAKALTGLAHAGTLSGLAFEDLTGGLAKLAKNMQLAVFTPNSPAAAAFKALGIQVTDASGHLRGTEEVLDDVAEKFSHMEDSAGKTALAMNIFGRSGKDMIPFLNEGREGLAELKAEADRLGVSMTTEQAKAAEKYKDDMERVDAALKGLKIRIGSEVMPALDRLATWFTEKAPAMLEGISTAMKGMGEILGNTTIQVTALAVVFSYTLYPALLKAVVGIQTLMVQMALARMEGITFASFFGSMINPWILAAAAIAAVAIGLNMWAGSYSNAAAQKADADRRMNESSIQTGREFFDLSEKAKGLDAQLQETTPGTLAHRDALKKVNTVVGQMVTAYPEFLSYLHKENGEYQDLTGSIGRFTKTKLNLLEMQLGEEKRKATESKNEATDARGGGWSGIVGYALVYKGIADNATKEAEAHEASAKAIQGQIDALNGLKAAEKDKAPEIKPHDKPTKIKKETDDSLANYAAEQAAEFEHWKNMEEISMDGLQKQEMQINLGYAKKLETAYQAGASEEELAALNNARLRDIEQARTDFAKKQADERKKIAEEEVKAARANLEQYGTAQQGFLDGLDQSLKKQGTVFQQWQQMAIHLVDGVKNAFATGLQGILSGQMSFAQGLRSIFQGISNAVSQMISQIIAKKMANWVVDKAIEAWDKQRAAAKKAEAAANIAIGSQETAAEVTQSTVKTAVHTTEGTAGAWSAYGWIPWVGAALALAQIAQMNQSITGAAEGGWFDRPTMTMIGEGKRPELVVPDVAFKDFAANLSSNILAQERAAQAYSHQAAGYARAGAASGGGGSAGDTHLHMHMDGAVLLDGSQRGMRGLGGLVIDGARSKAREIGVVLTPGQVFGGM